MGLGFLDASDAFVGQCPCIRLGLPSYVRHCQEVCSVMSFWIMCVGFAACPTVGGLTHRPFNVVNRAKSDI